MSILKTAMPIIIISFFILVFIFSPDKIKLVSGAFKPIIISFAVAYLIDSLVRFIVKRLNTRRTQAILLSCILLLGIIVLIFSLFVPKIIENAESVISFVTNYKMDIGIIIRDIADRINNPNVDKVADEIIEVSSDLRDKINDLLKYFTGLLINFVATIGTSILSVITSFILSIYMLIEKEDLIARLKRFIFALFNERNSRMILEISSNANRIFKSYIVGKLLDSLIVGIITIIVFTIFNIPYAPLMGSLIGLFNLIPYFGPIIGAIPVVVVTFFISPVKALTALIIIIVIGQIDGNFIDPKIVGNNVGVSPFWVISAVIVGGTAFGPPGMILGVPTLVLVKTLVEEYVDKRLREKNMEDYQIEKIKVIETKVKK